MKRGEVELVGQFAHDTYVFKFGLFALKKMQQALKLNLGQITKAMQGDDLNVDHFIVMAKCALVSPEPSSLNEEAICDLIDDITLPVMAKAFGQAISGKRDVEDPPAAGGDNSASTPPAST